MKKPKTLSIIWALTLGLAWCCLITAFLLDNVFVAILALPFGIISAEAARKANWWFGLWFALLHHWAYCDKKELKIWLVVAVAVALLNLAIIVGG